MEKTIKMIEAHLALWIEMVTTMFVGEVVAVVELVEVDLVNERARRSHGVGACIEN